MHHAHGAEGFDEAERGAVERTEDLVGGEDHVELASGFGERAGEQQP